MKFQLANAYNVRQAFHVRKTYRVLGRFRCAMAVGQIQTRRWAILGSFLCIGSLLMFRWPSIPSPILNRAVAAEQRAQVANSTPPTVTTSIASPVGTTAMTLNGSIHPHGLPTTYIFEYGPTTAYGSKTPVAELPPRLTAYYHESWDSGTDGWFSREKLEHHGDGGASGGYVRYHSPSRDDFNHLDGIGNVHLTNYFYSGRFNLQGKSLYLGAGDPDLRDARVSLFVRGNNWVPNGSELMWWTQSQSNLEVNLPNDSGFGPGFHHANWAYTGHNITDLLLTGKWEKAEYRLWNDAEKWSYAGNRGEDPHKLPYAYWPIDKAQRHLNLDIIQMLIFVDPKIPPTGSIDYDEIELAYRNYSLLLPSNGGELISSPKAFDKPGTLTDGWRFGKDRAWHSAEDPSQPQEFVYQFKKPVTIDVVQLHQNPEWPAKGVEVLVSTDGQTYSSLVKKVLPETPRPNANFGFTLDRGLSARAGFLKVVIFSGYKSRHWGLGEVEIFGTGATYTPENEVNFVNTDVGDLKRGETYHFRLVATNVAGTTRGEDQTFTVPADEKPYVVTKGVDRVSATSAKLEGRLNPLAQSTQYYFEYGPDKNYGMKSVEAYGGRQYTTRLVFAPVTGLTPGTTYHYRLVAVNKQGTTLGRDAEFTTPKK